ncbi:hypothetical protein TNCV_1511411 [Trichonephila clavipes]|nr:hypothetical protein TNCV_1511411 [Trichonephila clavipes]
MATGSSLTHNYSRSQSEVLRDLHRIADELQSNHESVRQIVTEYLERRKLEGCVGNDPSMRIKVSCFFVLDNAHPHTANIVKQLLAKKVVGQVEHPYSPDLNPPFFLFPRLKLALKGKRFDDIPDTQRNVTRRLNSPK